VQACAPDGSGAKITAIGFCHCGDAKDGEAAVNRIRGFAAPMMDHMGPISYVALNGMIDPMTPAGALNYWKSRFLPALSDDAIDAVVAAYAQSQSPMSQLVLEHFHGAATRVPVEATAYALRQTGFNCLALGQCNDQSQSAAMISWARGAFDSLERFGDRLQYANYLGIDEPADTVARASYGPNLPRLRKLKRLYDPDNFFHLNVNVQPE